MLSTGGEGLRAAATFERFWAVLTSLLGIHVSEASSASAESTEDDTYRSEHTPWSGDLYEPEASGRKRRLCGARLSDGTLKPLSWYTIVGCFLAVVCNDEPGERLGRVPGDGVKGWS